MQSNKCQFSLFNMPEVPINSIDSKKAKMLEKESTQQTPASTSSTSSTSSTTEEMERLSTRQPPATPAVNCCFGVYSELTEAKHLFRPKGNETVIEAIHNQIHVLNSANKTYANLIDIIQDSKEINDDILTDYKVWAMQQEYLYLLPFLQLAKKHINMWSWGACCQKAVGVSRDRSKSCKELKNGNKMVQRI